MALRLVRGAFRPERYRWWHALAFGVAANALSGLVTGRGSYDREYYEGMRQAPFALWIDNLSAPDPYFVLPLIMGVSMFVQQKLNPAPVDPLQAKIMMSLPLVFPVFFAFFPAGLVLYWVVNNLLSIAQQWHITRAIERDAKGK